jgi:hypothetical protein
MVHVVNVLFGTIGVSFTEKQIIKELADRGINTSTKKGKQVFDDVKFSDFVLTHESFVGVVRNRFATATI